MVLCAFKAKDALCRQKIPVCVISKNLCTYCLKVNFQSLKCFLWASERQWTNSFPVIESQAKNDDMPELCCVWGSVYICREESIEQKT